MRKIDGVNQSDAMPSSHCPTPTISCFGGTSMPISSEMESQLQAMQGGGHAMPEGLRAQMEGSFGHDFSNVRLHTDSAAADMSRSINAKAFTHGNDIYFNQGQFQPNTAAGQHLIAHELTHTVQQGGKVAREEGEENNLVDKIIKSGVLNEEDEEIKASNTITLFILIQILEKGNTSQENIGDIKKLKDYLNGQIINEYYDNLIESNTIETLIEFIKEIYRKNSNNCNYAYYKTTSDWEYQITNLSRDDFNSYKENALLSYQRNFVKNNINDFEWEEQNKMIPILSYNNRHVKTSDMYFHKNVMEYFKKIAVILCYTIVVGVGMNIAIGRFIQINSILLLVISAFIISIAFILISFFVYRKNREAVIWKETLMLLFDSKS